MTPTPDDSDYATAAALAEGGDIDAIAQALREEYERGLNAARNEAAQIVQAIVGLPMRLKAHRAARDVSMREVARATGMSFSTVCRIENGEDYAVSNLIALAAYLDAE